VDRGEYEPRLLTVKQAARFLATTPKTLYAMVWRREIVFVKIGRSVRFDLKDLEQMIERAKVKPREQAIYRERLSGGGSGGRL
jgi:excisionase family DNA binding protein